MSEGFEWYIEPAGRKKVVVYKLGERIGTTRIRNVRQERTRRSPLPPLTACFLLFLAHLKKLRHACVVSSHLHELLSTSCGCCRSQRNWMQSSTGRRAVYSFVRCGATKKAEQRLFHICLHMQCRSVWSRQGLVSSTTRTTCEHCWDSILSDSARINTDTENSWGIVLPVGETPMSTKTGNSQHSARPFSLLCMALSLC